MKKNKKKSTEKKLSKFGRLRIAFAMAAAMFFTSQTTGYRMFDTDDGNLMDHVDTTYRYLTDGEVELAREYFGDSIDYSQIKIFHRPHFFIDLSEFGGTEAAAVSLFGNIHIYSERYKSDDMSKDPAHAALFIHEMAHVWQYQNLNLSNYFNQIFRSLPINSESYAYALDEHERFADFENEQQAEMLEDLYREKQTLRQMQQRHASLFTLRRQIKRVRLLEEKISQEIPLRRLITPNISDDPSP